MTAEAGATECFIDSLLALPSDKLLDFAANFKPSGAAQLQAAAKSAANDGGRMQALLRAGDVDVDCADDRMWTPLMTAAAAGNEQVVSVLLGSGADWEKQNDDGDTPLHLALKHGHARCVALLLDGGCDPNVRTRDGATPLIVAASAGLDMATMRTLLDANRSGVDHSDQGGRTALIHAARGGHTGAAGLLLERGASPGAADRRGKTALHHAAGSGALEVLAMLVRAGAPVEAADIAGQTPRGAAAAACAAGGSLRHLAVVELLESLANGEDLTAEVLQMADEPGDSLPEPGSVMEVLREVRWAKPGVAMQVHEDDGVRKPRPFSKTYMHNASRRKGAGPDGSDYGVKIPRKILERLYSRQRRDENRRAALTSAGAELLAQPGLPQTTPAAHDQTTEAWPDEVVDRLNPARQPAAAPVAEANAAAAVDGAATRQSSRSTADAVRLALNDDEDEDTAGSPASSASIKRMDALVAAVEAVTQMKRGKLPAEALPPKSIASLLSRATTQIVNMLVASANGDDVEGMSRALQRARSQHVRLVGALGGAQLPVELGRRVETAMYECESRKAAVSSAVRRMNAAWRGGHSAEISAAIAAATSLSLPQPPPTAATAAATAAHARQGSLAAAAQTFMEKIDGLVQTQHSLKESCKLIDHGVSMDAAALARNVDLAAECSKYEATANSVELRQLQSAIAETYAMAADFHAHDAGKENTSDSVNASAKHGTDASSASRDAPTMATERRDRLKLETKALRAQRRVETRSAETARQRATAREQRLQQVQAQLASNRSILQQQQRELRASIASEEDRALQHQMALSQERAQRLDKYAARETRAVATKTQLEVKATANLRAAQAAREQRYVLRSIETDAREEASAEQRRLAQQRRDHVARRRESIDAQRLNKLETKLGAAVLQSPRPASASKSSMEPEPEPEQVRVGVKGTAAFLGTSRAQRESAVVLYGGATATTSRDNNPFFYPKVTPAAATDPDAVWRETAFPYPEQTAPMKRRQVAGRWLATTTGPSGPS